MPGFCWPWAGLSRRRVLIRWRLQPQRPQSLAPVNQPPAKPMAVHELSLDKLQHFTLLATTTITATGNQTGVDLQGFEGDVQIILAGTAAGAGADLTFRIEESDDNSTYTAATGGGFTAIANAASKQVITLNSNDLKRYIRLSCTAETGTATSSVTCFGYGLKKYS